MLLTMHARWSFEMRLSTLVHIDGCGDGRLMSAVDVSRGKLLTTWTTTGQRGAMEVDALARSRVGSDLVRCGLHGCGISLPYGFASKASGGSFE